MDRDAYALPQMHIRERLRNLRPERSECTPTTTNSWPRFSRILTTHVPSDPLRTDCPISMQENREELDRAGFEEELKRLYDTVRATSSDRSALLFTTR
jgi:hypothetical protein